MKFKERMNDYKVKSLVILSKNKNKTRKIVLSISDYIKNIKLTFEKKNIINISYQSVWNTLYLHLLKMIWLIKNSKLCQCRINSMAESSVWSSAHCKGSTIENQRDIQCAPINYEMK